METRTISILPTSIDQRRAYYTIHGGSVKYLTQKLRLSDFELQNVGQKPIYFGPKGIYSLIKSIQFLKMEGNIIDAMYKTDYMAIKMLHPDNQKQRDINRILFQNAALSVDVPSLGQLGLAEEQGRQDATKIGGYVDLSFMSNYLMARNISTDFLQIQIEFVDSSEIMNWYTFSKNSTLFVDEVLSAEPVDKADVIVYDMIVPDKFPIAVKNSELDTDSSRIGPR